MLQNSVTTLIYSSRGINSNGAIQYEILMCVALALIDMFTKCQPRGRTCIITGCKQYVGRRNYFYHIFESFARKAGVHCRRSN